MDMFIISENALFLGIFYPHVDKFAGDEVVH